MSPRGNPGPRAFASLALSSLVTATLITGCVRPQKEEPVGTLIEAGQLGLTGPATQPVAEGWWHAFGDPQLDRLVDAALSHNPSLDQALARVRSSGAQLSAERAGLKPRFTLDGDETWQRFSENYYIPPPYGGNRYWVGTVGANMSWTLDFWGRQAAVIRQMQARDLAARLDVWSARLAMSGAMAQAYLDLYRAYATLDIAQRTLEQREQLARLTNDRFVAGLETSVERDIARARIAEACNALEQATSARDLAVHELAALSARGADSYSGIGRPRIALDTALPLPEALPIDLLARRPDVLAARARVDAADAGRAAAKAAFYPDLSLKAFAGVQAIGLDELAEGGSVIYGAGPALHLPLFDAKRLRASYKTSTAELDLAVASYNEVVLNAVRQTADQISLIDSLTRQAQLARQRLEAAESAHEVAKRRYGAGLVTQLVVLNAESEVLAARRDILALDCNRAVARITLLLTLGGSFDPARSGESYGRTQ